MQNVAKAVHDGLAHMPEGSEMGWSVWAGHGGPGSDRVEHMVGGDSQGGDPGSMNSPADRPSRDVGGMNLAKQRQIQVTWASLHQPGLCGL